MADIVNDTIASDTLNSDPGSATGGDKPSSPQRAIDDSATPAQRKLWEEFRQRIDVCKIYRRKLIQNWTVNIDYRRGKPFASQTDEDRISVNLDWSLTKAKQAALFSQVPQVHIDHAPQTQAAGPWLYAFEQRLNDTLETAGIESAMDEVMVDVINASGIGGILVAHESITRPVQMPSIDPSTIPPEFQQQFLQHQQMPDGSDVPMETVPKVIDHRYVITRISPADLLWPISFTGSDFDNAPWIGRTGRLSWAQAVNRFGLTDADRDAILGEERTTLDRLTHDIDKDKTIADELVGYDELFYKENEYNVDGTSFVAIHHLVFVQGKDIPVIDEPWKGQQVDQNDPDGVAILGAQRFPIRILTLSYITDETIPPSDSAVGRAQINELNKSRTQYMLQRERSLPVRWFDVNFIDPAIQQSLMRGTWQAMIPVAGDGSRRIGEVSRANIGPENLQIDGTVKADLAEIWQLPPNQPGYQPEAPITQDVNNPLTRIGRERAKVARFFCTISEVLGGLLVLYEPDGSFGPGFDPGIAKTLTYSILADSTVLVDSNQRLQRLINLLNLGGKSGWLDIAPILKEIVTLSGVDPNSVVKPPAPKPPVEPNISLRLTGVEDMLNPMTLAFLIKSGQAPTPDLIAQAKELIQQSVTSPQPPQGAPPGAPPGPGGPVAGQPQPVPPIQPPPPQVGEAHPQWGLMPKINDRVEGQGGNQKL